MAYHFVHWSVRPGVETKVLESVRTKAGRSATMQVVIKNKGNGYLQRTVFDELGNVLLVSIDQPEPLFSTDPKSPPHA